MKHKLFDILISIGLFSFVFIAAYLAGHVNPVDVEYVITDVEHLTEVEHFTEVEHLTEIENLVGVECVTEVEVIKQYEWYTRIEEITEIKQVDTWINVPSCYTKIYQQKPCYGCYELEFIRTKKNEVYALFTHNGYYVFAKVQKFSSAYSPNFIYCLTLTESILWYNLHTYMHENIYDVAASEYWQYVVLDTPLLTNAKYNITEWQKHDLIEYIMSNY